MKENILSLFREKQESEKVELEKYNEETLSIVHDERRKQNETLQKEYNKCEDYKSKLIFIYSLLSIVQEDYLKYTNNEILNQEHLDNLIQELETKDKIDETLFKDFVKEFIQSLNSGHVSLHPIKQSERLINPNQDGLETINLEQDALDEKRQEVAEEAKGKNIVFDIDNETIYIQIKSFRRELLAEDQIIFKKIEEVLRNKNLKNIIFDIRGNAGGSDEYFEKLSIFTSKDINTTERFRDLLTNKNYEITLTDIVGNPDAKEYNRYLLVDNKVFSTAEKLVMICKESKFATVIGEKTGGEGFGFTPFTLDIIDENYEYDITEGNKIYTNNGIKITFPVEVPINEQGEIDYENLYNITPDIVCDGKDALKVAVQEIKEKQQEFAEKGKDFKGSHTRNTITIEDFER